MLVEESFLRVVTLGMIQRGDPLTWDRVREILVDETLGQEFVDDERVDVGSRNEVFWWHHETVVESRKGLRWRRTLWVLDQYQSNPQWALRAHRFWSTMGQIYGPRQIYFGTVNQKPMPLRRGMT